MSDLISRQAAIDEIEYELEMINSALDSITLDFNARERLRQRRGEAREILNSIQQLPSAQPERTCVNCGRTVNNGGWYADGETRCPIEEYCALPKDGYCHLWEKRNVTDDDYPERREE